jgi:hypothetical protein
MSGSFDVDAQRDALEARVSARREQVLGFVQELDRAGVVPGAMPEGILETLAEADVALQAVEERLHREEVPVSEMEALAGRLDEVESHIREVQQELWRAAVARRATRT